jgi:hypothetical protein
MPKPPPPELFAERPIRSDFGRTQVGVPYAVRRVITLFVLVILIGGGVWFYKSRQPDIPGVIPTIKSEGPYKQRPEQPGGIDIPHQDVEVYQGLDNTHATDKAPEVEHLMPMPEVPQSMPATPPVSPPSQPKPAEIESLIDTVPQAETPKFVTTVSPTPVAPTSVPPTTASVSVAPAPQPAPVIPTQAAPIKDTPATLKTPPVEAVSPVMLKLVTVDGAPVISNEAPAPAQILKPTAKTEGDTAVQLASVQDKTVAEQMRLKLQGKYASILGGLSLQLVRADLGAKGVYYRIQSSPTSTQQAQQICLAMKNTNAGCILVRH